ncbi:MAG: carbohydrate ABC transporter permease, partial [Anaerolineales bacterium]
FTTVCLALFLSPFLFMIFTSLKTTAQMSVIGSPIWPAKSVPYTLTDANKGVYTLQVNKSGTLVDVTIDMSTLVGKKVDVYNLPFPDGTKRDMAVIQGFQKGSIVMDPANPAAAPIAWNDGYFKGQPRALWEWSPTWTNFHEMWDDIKFPGALLNTVYYAFVTTIGTLLSCILVAFGFSRFRFPGRDSLFILLISILFLPIAVTVIPTFTFWTQVTKLGLGIGVGTWWPLIIPSFFANPYDVFLLRQYFMTLPKELDEAAMIDGAGPFRILWAVIIPQSYPVIVAVTVFHIVWAWNDYFGPLIYLSTNRPSMPISVALAYFNGMYGSRPELIQAGALLALIFPLILFFAAQRFFVQGIVITGVEK